jgi:hypothetical protein
MALHSGFVFRPAFLHRLAAASDLQKLFPAAAANSSMLADGFQVFGVMLLNIPKDHGDLRRAVIKSTLRGLCLVFQRGDFGGDFDGIEVREIAHWRGLRFGTERLAWTFGVFAAALRAALGGTGGSVGWAAFAL